MMYAMQPRDRTKYTCTSPLDAPAANGRFGFDPSTFLVPIAMLVLVVATLLRWIDDLSKVGSVTKTTARVKRRATQAAGCRPRILRSLRYGRRRHGRGGIR